MPKHYFSFATGSVDPPDEVVDSIEKVQLIPQTLDALKLLATFDYGVFFISNQIGIAKGRLTREAFERINAHVLELLKPTGIKILKTYYCPHEPSDNCECRKPKPGMLLQAVKEFDIDLDQSFMVGDRLTGVLTGIHAGIKTIVVQTGLKTVETDQVTFIASNVLEAVQYIASHSS